MQDIINEKHGVFISEAVQHEAIGPEIADFQAGSEGSYAPIFESAQEAIQQGLGKAFLVPAVLLAVRGTLRTLDHEEVAYQLPFEVDARYAVARQVVKEVAGGAIEDGVYKRGYRKAPMPRSKEPKNYERLYSSQYMGDTGASAFRDASWTAGGASKLLEAQSSPTEDRVKIIQHSSGLLIVSRLKDNLLSHVRAHLGTPYLHSHHMWISGDGEDQRVRFRPSVPMLRDAYYLSLANGCPAAKVKPDRGQEVVLHEEWRKIVGYLIPPRATTDLYVNPTAEQQPALVQ
jgi:hypothetical protein